MAGFDDIVIDATPAMAGGGHTTEITEGTDYFREFQLFDDVGTPVDLSSGATVTCTVRNFETDALVFTMTGAGTATGFTLAASKATLTNLVSGIPALRCRWGCSIAFGGKEAQMWFPENSPFTIRSK